ncbi:MAG: ROK family protein [Thermodesulfobacteriota bacterium]|jgi:glucokinase|nr:MAG: ROK family protein [Thermodesulfobacteriota bacterium]
MKRVVLAADLGGTNIRVAAIDEQGTIEKRLQRPTHAHEGEASVLRSLFYALGEVYQAFPENRIKGVGVGIAGAIDIEKGIVTQSPNLVEFDGYPLRDKLQASFLKHLAILVDNDANLAAMGEKWKGAGVGVNDLICLTLGTGIGGGIIIRGNLVHGTDGMAGEVGHVTVDPQGPPCNCGNRGCLEALASATAIKREAIEALFTHPESELHQRCRHNPETITAELVYQSAQAGDQICRKIFQDMGRYLGIGIAGLVNIFNPEMVVLGGKVSKSWDMFFSFTQEEVHQRALKIPGTRVKIVPAVCGDDAGLLGAAYLVFHQKKLS